MSKNKRHKKEIWNKKMEEMFFVTKASKKTKAFRQFKERLKQGVSVKSL